jgi:uncharacterized protein
MKISLSILCFITVSASAQTAPLPRLQDIAPKLKVQAHPNKNELNQIYIAALKNLDTQFQQSADGTVYVSTGDIHAEWLRDSSVQVRPYLFFAKENPDVAKLIKGVVLRQARYISIDPYANAYYENYQIHERKYELDSLVNPILLAWTYWKVTGDTSIFTHEVWSGFKVALQTMKIEQDHNIKSTYAHPHLSKNPVARTGLIWSGFRPSDDRCHFNYLIPANAMAAQGLRALVEISTEVMNDSSTARLAEEVEKEVRAAIKKFAVARTNDGQTVYAYEVDGLGHAIAMDDANLPSLLSLPYYGFVDLEDNLYQATRLRILSSKNPFYFTGSSLRGIGSPHTPKNMVWPLSLITEAITSTSLNAFDFALKMLINSNHGSSGLHESVDVNNPARFTRADFGWPNAMYVEMALTTWNGFSELPKVATK